MLFVTNLNDSGSGSLRDALGRADPKRLSIIVFRTGGTITLSSVLSLSRSCVYVAGQTAPGGGIQLRSPEGAGNVLLHFPRNGSASDVVVRYLRVRPGRGEAGASDAISIDGGSNIVLDHLSVQWGNDEGIGFQTKLNSSTQRNAPIEKVTIQRSIVAATLRPHSTGTMIGGTPFEDRPPSRNISLHNNLFAHNAHRNPRVSEHGPVEFVNNVVYNWRNRVGETVYTAEVDYINNYLKAGPWSDPNRIWYHESRGDGVGLDPSIYISGNIAEPRQMDPNADNKQLFARMTDSGIGSAPSSYFRSSPFGGATFPINRRSAQQTYTAVLEDVGANARLDCQGGWVNVQDRLDRDIIGHVTNRSGPSADEQTDHHSDYGGYPSIATGSPCSDSDSDGLPDEWESLYFNCQTCAKPESDANGDGFTNIEAYVNGIRP